MSFEDQLEPLLYGVADTCRLMGVSRDTVYRLLRSGDLALVKVGRGSLVPAESIRTFIESRQRPFGSNANAHR